MPEYLVEIEYTEVAYETRRLEAVDEHDAVTSVIDWTSSQHENSGVTHWTVTEV